jgi:hypothetical protein
LWLALASDRRITWQIGGAAADWEDTENKAVVLCGHFLLGYTGFARLGGVKTEQWVVDQLSGAAPSSYFRVLTTEAQKAVDDLHVPLDRSGHAFVAVGFSAVSEDVSGELHAGAGPFRTRLKTVGYGHLAVSSPPQGFRLWIGPTTSA